MIDSIYVQDHQSLIDARRGSQAILKTKEGLIRKYT